MKKCFAFCLAVSFFSAGAALASDDGTSRAATTPDSRRAMITTLPASGPHPSLGDQAPIFDRFVGTWDYDYATYAPDGRVSRSSGEVIFGWIIDGRALQDIWITYPEGAAAEREIGTTLRFYDTRLGQWRLVWMVPRGPDHRPPRRRSGGRSHRRPARRTKARCCVGRSTTFSPAPSRARREVARRRQDVAAVRRISSETPNPRSRLSGLHHAPRFPVRHDHGPAGAGPASVHRGGAPLRPFRGHVGLRVHNVWRGRHYQPVFGRAPIWLDDPWPALNDIGIGYPKVGSSKERSIGTSVRFLDSRSRMWRAVWVSPEPRGRSSHSRAEPGEIASSCRARAPMARRCAGLTTTSARIPSSGAASPRDGGRPGGSRRSIG